MDFCQRRFHKRLETLKVIDTQLDYLWHQLETQISKVQEAIFKARAKSNRNLWAVIASVVAGNILKIAGRVRTTACRHETKAHAQQLIKEIHW